MDMTDMEIDGDVPASFDLKQEEDDEHTDEIDQPQSPNRIHDTTQLKNSPEEHLCTYLHTRQ